MGNFDFKSFFYTTIFSLLLSVVFLMLVGVIGENPFLPILATLTIFMLVGVVVAYFSDGVTIIEPGLGAIFSSLVLYILMPLIRSESLAGVSESDWLIVMMNNIVVTFIGAWLGEKLYLGYKGQELEDFQSDSDKSETIAWTWVLAGTALGLMLSMIIISIFGMILNSTNFTLLLIIGVAFFVNGLVVGRFSPGVTMLEAGISGFLVMTLILNIFRAVSGEIPILYILMVLIGAFILTFVGAYVGEKLQEKLQENSNNDLENKDITKVKL